MTKFNSLKTSGFSLIETLIAITILMIAITGPLSLVQAGLFSSNHERNEVTAIYLAQEAIEFIKNVRDSNSYSQYTGSTVSWLTIPYPDQQHKNTLLTDNAAACGVSCYVDPHGTLSGSNLYIEPVSAQPNQYLRLYVPTGRTIITYRYGQGTLTPFIRTVTITPVADSQTVSGYNEVTVTVTVTWNDNLAPRSYTISTNLFNYEQGSGS